MKIEDIREKMVGFENKYGTLMVLKVNIRAINEMLIKRGREQELFEQIVKIIDNYEKNTTGV